MGKILKLVILSASVFASPVLAQVDTLVLAEISSIPVSEGFNRIYIEDFDGDSLKDIVLCSENHIFFYNASGNYPVWTSPVLNYPQNLLFADMDNDSKLDISCFAGQNIYIFNPHIDNLIWTSPSVDANYKCYTIGDRNGDGWGDIVVVSKEPFTRYGNYDNSDTVWIETYNGASFDPPVTYIKRLANYYYQNPFSEWITEYYQEPYEVFLNKFSNDPDDISIFLSVAREDYQHVGGVGTRINDGVVYAYRGGDLGLRYTLGGGKIYFRDSIILNDSTFIYAIGSSRGIDYPWAIPYRSDYSFVIAADTGRQIGTLWEVQQFDDSDLKGPIMDDFKPTRPGMEICYCLNDYLSLCGIGGGSQVWQRHIDRLNTIISKYESSLFTRPQIACQVGPYGEVRFIDGSNGQQTASVTSSEAWITAISDYNNDGDDELFAIEGATLLIYGLQRTGISDEVNPPENHQLLSSFPNPFNSQTRFYYNISEPGAVSLTIYNIMGERAAVLFDGIQQAGEHSVVWDAGNLSSGVYFARLDSGRNSNTLKIVLLK